MDTTSASLLDRLRRPEPAKLDWHRLHEIYAPWIRRQLVRASVPADETDDLVQEVFTVVFRKLPGFDRWRDGSFRAWLRQVTVNQVRNWRRKSGGRPIPTADADFLTRLEDPRSALARQWDADHDAFVFERLVEVVRPDFASATWAAFRGFALDGRPVAEVAAECGLSEASVLQAKSRVFKRLREEAGGLLD